MAVYSPHHIWGERDLFLLSDPAPRFSRARLRVDDLEETWQAPAEDSLVEGDIHPTRPGMIIDEVSGTIEIPGQAYVLNVTSLGSLDNSQPTKIIARGQARTLGSGWDMRSVRYLSWHAAWKPCKGVSATNTIHCDKHAFPLGQRVVFSRKTGGSGITAQSSTSLGVIYFVAERGANHFKVSLTLGGAVHALGSDISACEVIAAEFALGSPHPDHPTLYLAELKMDDEKTDWKTVEAVYLGLEESKPYHRLITVNGQQFSSSEPIAVDLPGGWVDPRNSNFILPKIVVTDTYLVGTGILPTSSVPSFAEPPNAPTIASYVITADDDQLVYNYPYGWTLVSTPQQATLNSQLSTMVYSLVYEYNWPVMFK